ncbi:bifunctional cyclohexadienyl dehydrogenase/ 3-phosphoshikimate 1-carboxyvinyltransferase [Candidatus Omnitrophus magneticus]|uniref:3-phosphoshikimate 1-carboxyvinyltransferase n=1 Tax=Candidatus Omnitrophus magneticus TaxID=1609969 RepID=A0A0F0CUI2_9BACT|nr:bifunctional cyclohexadienyl dehydrogenase/ 3-phosphoshikimate 1-carboxyvinyltransferase [Candidatus Omnitrophus magneticus]
MDWNITPAKTLSGEIIVPPDKSISHRAIMFGSLAKGGMAVNNFLSGEDCLRTLNAFKEMGIEITMEENNKVIIHGKGLRGLKKPAGELYMGNSGTSMRLISGILAGQEFTTILTGDESLSKRPMARVIKPLKLMGAQIEAVDGGDHAPLRVTGRGTKLSAIEYNMPMASAQVKSCVLLAGMYADGETSIVEPFKSRDHTERLLSYFGAEMRVDGLRVTIVPDKELRAKDITIPGDISSAAFFIVAGLIVEGAHIILKNVGLNGTRVGIINVLKRMHADINVLPASIEFEPYGNIEIRFSELKGTTVEREEIPLLIDEVPILLVAGSMAEGETLIKGTGELKVKETDRVKSMMYNLREMGVSIREEGDTLIVTGKKNRILNNSSKLESFGDHRTAMSMAISALVSKGECVIHDTACVDTSYPNFLTDLSRIKS